MGRLKHVLLRMVSVGLTGILVSATPVFATPPSLGVAGVAAVLEAVEVNTAPVAGVGEMESSIEINQNAREVLADDSVKYEMTEEELASQVELAEQITQQAEEQEEVSPYANVAISQVNNYVNIRSGPSEDDEILGKIYNNAAATILDTVETDEGTWYQIESGSVEGYIKSDYFVTGEEAEAIAYEVGRVTVTVNTETLRLRAEPSLDSRTVTLLSEDEKYEMIAQENDFVQIQIDDDVVGYVLSDYVRIRVDFQQAISLEEEQEALEAQRRAEEAAAEAEREEESEDDDEDESWDEEDDEDESWDDDDDEDESWDDDDDEEDESWDDDEDDEDESWDDEDDEDESWYDDEDESGDDDEDEPGDDEEDDEDESGDDDEDESGDDEEDEPGHDDEDDEDESGDEENDEDESGDEEDDEDESGDDEEDEEDESWDEEDDEEEEEPEEEEPEVSSGTSSVREELVDYALSFVGNLRYVYGGTSLSSGVDCSGFVQQVFKHFGYSLPRTSGAQGGSGRSVSSSEMQPGDIVYYGGHVAIYIGGGQVVHASNEKTGVKVSTWNYRSVQSIRNVIG